MSKAEAAIDESEPLPETEYRVPGFPASLLSLPGVFSARRLDAGTELLLEYMRGSSGQRSRILDFGCGNGVLGIGAALMHGGAEVLGLDDSAMAVESAEVNAARNGLSRRMTVLHAFSLDSVPGLFDLILSNPPFHQGARVSLDTSLEMFRAATGKLKPGGRLLIVANRHLGYAAHLRRIFGNCRECGGTKKYTLLEAERR